jgi:hypothetical protein
VPAGEPTLVIVRLAAGWDSSAARTFCAGLEAAARHAPDDAVLHRGRNLIFRAALGEDGVAVKRFPVAGIRRLVYRYRASKAVRAFDHAARMLELGIGTPHPFAAVELRRGGALLASFYCCALVETFREARELKRPDAADRAALLERLGAFVGTAHERGVLPGDLTSGNVLMVPAAARDGGVGFTLVDVNRMRFGRVGVRRGIANLAMLRLADDGALLAGYCHTRGLRVEDVASWYRTCLALRSARQRLFEGTRPLRRRLGM